MRKGARTIGAILALSTGSGCTALFTPQWEGVWFFDVPAIENSECLPVIDENFEDAEVPEITVDGEWTIVDDQTLSNATYFVEILAGKGGAVFVVIGDEVYPGQQDKKTLSVSWEGSTDDTFDEVHEDGYHYGRTETSTVTTTITLLKADGGTANGNIEIATASSIDYAESDRWKPNQNGINYTQMPSTAYITGDAPTNLPDSNECADDDCAITIDYACSGDASFLATFAGKYENGMFGPINEAGQDPGAGFGTYTY